MNNTRADSYSEVYTILNMMNPKYRNKIPRTMMDFIKREMNDEYKPIIINNMPLYKQKINTRTFSILAILNLNYWCEDEDHKKELLRKYADNDIKREKELYDKYNPDKLFRNDKPKVQKEEIQEKSLMEVKCEKWYKKVFLFLRNVFRK